MKSLIMNKLAVIFVMMSITACNKYDTSIYEVQQPTPSAPKSVYVGCYLDTSTRALPVWLINSDSTVDQCIALARESGYKYAGLQYGGQCFAGNTLGYAADPASDCNMPCAADPNETCGGVWHNSVYSVQE